MQLALMGNAQLGAPLGSAASSSLDASGDGPLAPPRAVLDALQQPRSVTLEDHGVGGTVLSYADSQGLQIALPLSFAKFERVDATLTITVHAAVHPDCPHKGSPMPFTCTGGAAEAEEWQSEIEQAVERGNERHWGVSKSFIREQRDLWEGERVRCKGLTVAEYLEDIGLGGVYDETWGWCAGVLTGLEAKDDKSAADLKSIAYFKSKVEKTEMYEDMELTDYMNILKLQDLGGNGNGLGAKTTRSGGRLVSYATFIAAESDSSGRRKVGEATVFVSHVWKMTAKDFFEVCLAELEENDYAWVDLYLHNQYQGPVSTIGDENSMYWINKFGELVGGIGKVIAIVTDWEAPVMLTRIWCLFELNAAIDTGADLRFVATAAERQDLSLNLNQKFEKLGTLVSSIEVRDCDAKRPHEIQDKAIFLSKLRGIEDDVNDKLRKEMQRWLCDAAEGVIERTDPARPPLGLEAMRLEVADTGKLAARLTQLLEKWPRIVPVMHMLTWFAAVVFSASFAMTSRLHIVHAGGSPPVAADDTAQWFQHVGQFCDRGFETPGKSLEDAQEMCAASLACVAVADGGCDGTAPFWLCSSITFTTAGSCIFTQSKDVFGDYAENRTECDLLGNVKVPSQRAAADCAAQRTLTCICLAFAVASIFIVRVFEQQQLRRQLRQPPVFGENMLRRSRTINKFVLPALDSMSLVVLPVALSLALDDPKLVLYFQVGGFATCLTYFSPFIAISDQLEIRASLCIKAGWLRAAMGDIDAAARIADESDAELKLAAPYGMTSDAEGVHREWTAAAARARFMCDSGRRLEGDAIMNEVAAAVAENSQTQYLQLRKAAGYALLPTLLCVAKLVNKNAPTQFWRNFGAALMFGSFLWTILYWAADGSGTRAAAAWKKYGPLLRANIMVAVRADDDQILTVLAESAAAGCDIPAGCRPHSERARQLSISGNISINHFLESNLPEWEEFLGRMATGATAPELRAKWESYRVATIALTSDAVQQLKVAQLDKILDVIRPDNTATPDAAALAHLLTRGAVECGGEAEKKHKAEMVLHSYFAHPAWGLVDV